MLPPTAHTGQRGLARPPGHRTPRCLTQAQSHSQPHCHRHVSHTPSHTITHEHPLKSAHRVPDGQLAHTDERQWWGGLQKTRLPALPPGQSAGDATCGVGPALAPSTHSALGGDHAQAPGLLTNLGEGRGPRLQRGTRAQANEAAQGHTGRNEWSQARNSASPASPPAVPSSPERLTCGGPVGARLTGK